MTVCIAAIANKNKKLIMAVDTMITASFPIPYQYETSDVPKRFNLTPFAIALVMIPIKSWKASQSPYLGFCLSR